jgi:succinate dehydrogenase / fumarate reductase iron-sulfur subunit
MAHATSGANVGTRTIKLRVKRQDGPGKPSYWEDFEIPYKPSMNVISCLQELQRRPKAGGGSGDGAAPPTWDCSCLEEVCGACTMVINGRVRQSCSALVDQLEQPIRLEPMTKFPVVRDLQVDRGRMFEGLKKVKAWVPIDGTYDLGPGPRMNEAVREQSYRLSQCMTCGCCVESCPQFNDAAPFIGPAAISQVVLFNSHPTGALNANERLDAIMGVGGVSDCGNAQNCVQVCPKGIPLTWSIAKASRATTLRMFARMFDL